jgi:phosphoenolpyruvate---glycerone phosphotransferase subunit DhaL
VLRVLTPPAAREMLEAVARHVIDHVDRLTAADQAIGDGDHGIGMRRGCVAVLEHLKTENPQSVESVLKTAGRAILSQTGGAAGVVFGTFFLSGSTAVSGPEVDAAGFAQFLRQGLDGVKKRGGARPGQKTMLDALAPAADAAREAEAEGLAAAARAAAEAAAQGVEATKSMMATTGKAAALGGRSLGHPDPGAISISLILDAMRDYIERA